MQGKKSILGVFVYLWTGLISADHHIITITHTVHRKSRVSHPVLISWTTTLSNERKVKGKKWMKCKVDMNKFSEPFWPWVVRWEREWDFARRSFSLRAVSSFPAQSPEWSRLKCIASLSFIIFTLIGFYSLFLFLAISTIKKLQIGTKNHTTIRKAKNQQMANKWQMSTYSFLKVVVRLWPQESPPPQDTHQQAAPLPDIAYSSTSVGTRSFGGKSGKWSHQYNQVIK